MSVVVSNDYRNMMKEAVLQSRMEMEISFGSRTVTLTDKDIVSGSFSINWRASNNGGLSLGACYSASMSFSSFKCVESEIDGNYLTITPTIFYLLGNGQEQAIPLGVFRCDDPKVFAKTTSYDCYDFMLAFDKPIESRFSGTPFNVIDFICRKCGIANGNTSTQIASMINSSQSVTIDPNYLVTYRDALSCISMVLGGYCIIDRYGRLAIRQFEKTPSFTLIRKRRTSSSFAGYRTIFCGVKCRFLANQNFYPYSDIDDSEGLILDLGDIPTINASETAKREILSNIKEHLEDYEYYPCEIDFVGDPSIEAGDMITTVDREGYAKNVLLTSVTFAWRATSNLVSEGGNPKLSNVSTAQKRASASQDQMAKAASVVTATFVNANPIEVTDEQREEISALRFVTTKDLTAIFGAEIPIYSDGDGYIDIVYTDGGIEGDSVKARIHEGYNLVTLVNHLYYQTDRVVLLQLKAKTDAIGTGTAPTVTIAQDAIRSYIFAQGIEIETPWDGIISISEYVDYVETMLSVYGITDGISISIESPVSSALSEIVSDIATYSQTIEVRDTMELSVSYEDWVLRMGMGHRAGMGRMFAPITI